MTEQRRPLTQRVIRAVTGTAALLLGILAALAYMAMHTQEDELTDRLLNAEVHQLDTLIVKPGLMPVGVLHAAPNVNAYLTRGEEGKAELPAEVRELPIGLHIIEPPGREWHVAVTDTPDGQLTVVVDGTDAETRVRQFGYTLLALWLVCVGITALIARSIAAAAVAPVVEATRAIARFAPARADDTPSQADEATLLIETFNRFRDGADETVAREREFAANLDHEIRTPLTRIRTDAELLAIDLPAASAQRRRLMNIVGAVDEIIATSRSTLTSARGSVVSREPVDLSECLAGIRDTLGDRAAARGVRIVIDVEPGLEVQADRQALLTVCRNIVRNAIDHAAPATLRIAARAGGIRFEDDGPGVEPAALPHLFERYYQGHRVDEGVAAPAVRRGLGLAIARRICDLQDWEIRVDSPVRDGRGTRFEIAFGDSGAWAAPATDDQETVVQ